ncbi:hypothetical protein OKW21_002403 [Catalinimonas alkaloidigena]|uniref:hypothetical protein n=1 Tax=Catalinimonas alkaloidigena TaxID=1075417 RepID=UPI002404F961|nr:hypothetical protein [Catalinimonas alkaloidigena]MDF9797140.1 hypothetical protein [Catalinimonas alkaloidigena]
MKIKFSILFLLYFTVLIGSVNAQYFPSEVWHEGKLTLLSGDEISGKIKYNFEADLVQVNLNNTLQTYSARKILFFEIYDEEVSRYRQFYALPYNVRPNYKVPMLFEVLYENTMTLLCRESVVQETVPQYGYYSYYGNRYATRYRLSFDYFFLNPKGDIIPYSQKKDDLYNILSQNKDNLEKYVKENRLKYDRHRDLVRITAYYNSLLNS